MASERATEAWGAAEHLLVEECGLLPDQGLTHQRPNLIRAIRSASPADDVVRAAIEFLTLGGLHKIRVGGELMTREQVAAELRGFITEMRSTEP